MNPSLALILGFVTATAFSMALIPIVVRFAGAFHLYDRPDYFANSEIARKIHTTPIPRLGGIAIVLSFFLTQVIWTRGSPISGVYLGGIGVFIVGLIDDVVSLKATHRFILQAGIAAFAIWYQGLVPAELNFGGGVHFHIPYAIGFCFSIFVIVGAINTLNMIDGLDGLAGGVALIGVVLLAFLYFLNSQDLGLLLYVACPMIGAIIGFLRYNTHPAVIFMGDSGSNWLGFMIGAMMLLLLTGKQFASGSHQLIAITPLPIMSVVLCLAIPVFDTALVMVGRIRRGVSPMQADKTHLHHALLNIGLSQTQAVSALYFLALLVGVIGVLPIALPNYGLELTPYIGVILAFCFVLVASRINANGAIGILMQRANIRETSNYTVIARLVRYWENFNRYILYVILLVGPAFAGVVRPEVGIAAAAIAVLITVSIILSISGRRDDFLDSTCIALASTIILIANNANTMMVEWLGKRVSIHPIYNALFGILLVSTILLFLVTVKKRYFVFKPSDFLLATIPLILLLVPEPFRSDYRINIISMRSIVAFAAVRTLAKRKKYVMAHVKGVTLIALAFVFLAGVFGLRMVY